MIWDSFEIFIKIDLFSIKKRLLQDENHHLLFEQKQVQAKYIKFSEEFLTLRQELQEVEFNNIWKFLIT